MLGGVGGEEEGGGGRGAGERKREIEKEREGERQRQRQRQRDRETEREHTGVPGEKNHDNQSEIRHHILEEETMPQFMKYCASLDSRHPNFVLLELTFAV